MLFRMQNPTPKNKMKLETTQVGQRLQQLVVAKHRDKSKTLNLFYYLCVLNTLFI